MRFSFLALLFLSLSAAAGDLTLGQKAPPLTLQAVDGTSYSTEALRGKVIILHFWATWCVPCREEMPLIARYAQVHAGQGIQVLGASIDNPGNLAEVKKVAASIGFPVGLLGSNYAGGYGRIWRLPVTFVIDRNGLLRHNGWDDDQQPLTQELLDREVTPLLG